MGNFRSRYDNQKAALRSAQIDRQIEQDANKTKYNCKILLLGLTGSGKSTIVNQMRIDHQGGFSHDTRMTYREAIYSNLVESAQALAAALRKFEIEPIEPSNIRTLEQVLEYHLDAELQSPTCPSPFTFTGQLAEAICRLWEDPTVPRFVENYGSQFDLMDNAVYFFTGARRIASLDYVPTDADILRCTQRNTCIVGATLSHGAQPLSLHLFELGGPRSERKKWIYYFDSVTSIIFCAALSDYDRVGPTNQNRMAESLTLFDSVINSPWFLRTSIILILTKPDLFRQKLPKVPLERYFQEYVGGPNEDNAIEYILSRFVGVNRANRTVYAYITQSMDISATNFVFSAIMDTILQNSLRDVGLL